MVEIYSQSVSALAQLPRLAQGSWGGSRCAKAWAGLVNLVRVIYFQNGFCWDVFTSSSCLLFCTALCCIRASQAVLVVNNPPANTGDLRDFGSIHGSGRSPGGGHGNSLQYSCLENPMDRGAWQATVHSVEKSRTWLRQLSTTAVSYLRFVTKLLLAQVSQILLVHGSIFAASVPSLTEAIFVGLFNHFGASLGSQSFCFFHRMVRSWFSSDPSAQTYHAGHHPELKLGKEPWDPSVLEFCL